MKKKVMFLKFLNKFLHLLQAHYSPFFNCYLAVPRPTLGHSRGDSLTNPMLIIAFSTILAQRSPAVL